MMRLYYELRKSPATFDYVNFLVRAEQERLKRQQDAISLRISYGERQQSQRDIEFTKDRKLWRINNLLIPLSRCLPSVADVAIGDGEQTLSYLPFTGPQAPCLKAPIAAREMVGKYLDGKKNPVSITIRDSDFESGRNSNLPAWKDVARWLMGEGYTPIFVPDTEAEIFGRELSLDYEPCYRPAAFYPELRLALFESCRYNLMAAGGPMEMALQSDVPVMIWKLLVPGMPMNTEDNMQKRGLLKGQWGAKKRFFTEPDTAENVIGFLEKEMRLAA
jgi:hypothetical protein